MRFPFTLPVLCMSRLIPTILFVLFDVQNDMKRYGVVTDLSALVKIVRYVVQQHPSLCVGPKLPASEGSVTHTEVFFIFNAYLFILYRHLLCAGNL